MVVVRFSVFFDKIRSGEKKQTIRPYEYYIHLKKGDKIHCYATKAVRFGRSRRPVLGELLYEGVVTKIRVCRWSSIKYDDHIARLDGFKDAKEMRKWFKAKYPDISPDKRFRIIRWE